MHQPRGVATTARTRDVSAGLGKYGRLEQDGLENLTHVPFHIIGEHARGAHAIRPAAMDRPDLDIDGLEAAEAALSVGELP